MVSGLKSRLLKGRSGLHRLVFRASKGRLLGRWGGLPVVMITTTGRRTGRPRTTMLVSPVQRNDAIVVVASNGGAPRHPDWFLNLQARPDVDVMMTGRRERMRARAATGKEKDLLWPLVTGRSPSYARYQQRTARDIPLVVLEPATATPGPGVPGHCPSRRS
jgi:deazaflavin-dependent oxidoreductase (nitroreductase family)